MSIDLLRALVPSSGAHDPIDGLITGLELQATATALPGRPEGPGLAREIAGFRAMLDGELWPTADPLGIGGLLTDAFRVACLMSDAGVPCEKLLQKLLDTALISLRVHERREQASPRLAFRELGLVIGLRALGALRNAPRPRDEPLNASLESFEPHFARAQDLLDFWQRPANRRGSGWTEHRDINEVMLASALLRPEHLFQRLPPNPLGATHSTRRAARS
jgi:hypothetical protein